MTSPTLPQIVEGLSDAKRRALLAVNGDEHHEYQAGERGWFAAFWLIKNPGNTFSVLADKGLLERRDDPFIWGRSQYRITPLGLEVRTHLLSLGEGM